MYSKFLTLNSDTSPSLSQSELITKLDQLESCIPSLKYIKFKFSNDWEHDFLLIDWFCDNGEIRAYRGSGLFFIVLMTKNRLTLELQAVRELDIDEELGISTKIFREYIRRAWDKKKTLIYCTSNLLFTPEEERTPFIGSKENEKSMIRNSAKLTEILNNIKPQNLDLLY